MYLFALFEKFILTSFPIVFVCVPKALSNNIYVYIWISANSSIYIRRPPVRWHWNDYDLLLFVRISVDFRCFRSAWNDDHLHNSVSFALDKIFITPATSIIARPIQCETPSDDCFFMANRCFMNRKTFRSKCAAIKIIIKILFRSFYLRKQLSGTYSIVSNVR